MQVSFLRGIFIGLHGNVCIRERFVSGWCNGVAFYNLGCVIYKWFALRGELLHTARDRPSRAPELMTMP